MRTNKQSAANVNLFDSLPIGSAFTIVSPFACKIPFRVHDRYVKVSAEHVEASDGRRWHFGATEGPGSHVVLVPEGSYSAASFDVNFPR